MGNLRSVGRVCGVLDGWTSPSWDPDPMAWPPLSCAPGPGCGFGSSRAKPPPVAVPGPGGSTLSAARAAALAEIESALGAVREAQKSGNFGQYGAALQRLDEAMGKFDAAK